MQGVMLEVGSQSKEAVHFVHSQVTTFFLFCHYFLIVHPPDRRLELFFPVVITIAHPPDRRLELFFSVIITIVHPPDRGQELFFPVVITITHPPDRRLELFFPVVITIALPPDRRLPYSTGHKNHLKDKVQKF